MVVVCGRHVPREHHELLVRQVAQRRFAPMRKRVLVGQAQHKLVLRQRKCLQCARNGAGVQETQVQAPACQFVQLVGGRHFAQHDIHFGHGAVESVHDAGNLAIDQRASDADFKAPAHATRRQRGDR